MIAHEKDGMRYAEKELPHNSTLAILQSEDPTLYRLYRDIETCMDQRYEPFSIVFDDGILLHSLADDFIGFVMNISEQEDMITITTTEDRQFHLGMHHELWNTGSFSRILRAVQLPDADFTSVFANDSNTLTVNGHSVSAFKDRDLADITVCDGIKRIGYLVGYTQTGYLICNNDRLFYFLFDYPECDVSTQYRELGFFWIHEGNLLFRTDYGYHEQQDFRVRDIKVHNGLAEVRCSTEANPELIFNLEV